VVPKVIADQLAFAPVANTAFLACSELLEGRSLEAASARVHHDLPDVMLMNWRVWPLAAAANFALVPVRHQVTFVNGVLVCWSAYLSHKSAHPSAPPPSL
jgi:protein Mpv17